MEDLEIRKKIVEILNGCFETDWVYNGEDEMPVKSFNKDEAADELVVFIREICPTLRAVDPPSALVGGGNSENSAGN